MTSYGHADNDSNLTTTPTTYTSTVLGGPGSINTLGFSTPSHRMLVSGQVNVYSNGTNADEVHCFLTRIRTDAPDSDTAIGYEGITNLAATAPGIGGADDQSIALSGIGVDLKGTYDVKIKCSSTGGTAKIDNASFTVIAVPSA